MGEAIAAPEDPVFVQVTKVKGLLSQAKRDLPESCSLFNIIYLHTNYLGDRHEFYVPSDKSLETIIIYKIKMHNMQQVGLLSYEKPTKVMELFQHTRILDWTLPVCFYPVSGPLQDLVTQVLKRKAPTRAHIHSSSATLYTMDKKGQKGVPLRCPRGYKVCQLGIKGIETMLQAWRYSYAYVMSEYQEFARHVPCIGLFQDSKQEEDCEVDIYTLPQAKDDEDPIAYASVCYCGSMAMLGCTEKHWVDGLMALVVQVCGRMMANKRLLAHMYVEERDANIRSLMDTLPGWKTEHEVNWVWSCMGDHCF